MALSKSFYNEIFENEQLWIDRIEKNLLNSIYCTYELRPFYLKKLQQLKQESENSNTKMVDLVIEVIGSIIKKIDEFDVLYQTGNIVDIKSLIPLFLTSQMVAETKKENQNNEIKNDTLYKENPYIEHRKIK